MTKPIATIGYEGAPLGEVLGRLNDAGVELLIDVRAVAASRRAGFSKTILGNSLNEVGIGYLHLRDLGTPKDGRMAAPRRQNRGDARHLRRPHAHRHGPRGAGAGSGGRQGQARLPALLRAGLALLPTGPSWRT